MDRRKAVISIGLALLACLVYTQVAQHRFVIYDDPQYVYENRWVRYGLTQEGIAKAFFSTMSANWHPLTWMSHMLDVSLFGLEPGPHHLVNVLIHALNGILLFRLFERMTGAVWRSAFVASLFVVHPLHVESVAWISERKDLLCALFGILAFGQYVGYARSGSRFRYAATGTLFACSLMSKPMLVTFPFLLLLIDYWPLRRFETLSLRGGAPFRGLVLEKIPFAALSAASCFLTLWAQTRGEAIVSVEAFPVWARMANATTACLKYVSKTVWPASLAVFYPNPGLTLNLAPVLASVFVLAAVTVLVVRHGRDRRYLPVGWFWFLGMLVPVIGLVQVGSQAMADRYTYLPIVGLFLIAVWGGDDLRRWISLPGKVAAAIAIFVLSAMTLLAWRQAGYWRDSYTLFGRMLAVVPTGNRLAHINLGGSYLNDGNPASAVVHFAKALQEAPDDEMANWGMGVACRMLGRLEEAVGFYRAVLRRNPRNAEARLSLGLTLADMGKPEEGYARLRELAATGDGDDRFALLADGMVLVRDGRIDAGIRRMREALVYAPNDPLTNMKLGLVLARNGRHSEAAARFREVVRLSPDDGVAWYNLALVLEQSGALPEAVACYEKAASVRAGDVEILGNLGIALGKSGRFDDAIARFREALRIDPGNEVARRNLAIATGMNERRGAR